jgi:hypothetical protein
MSSTTPNPSGGTEADRDSRLTIEDAGSTTDPTDLFDNDTTATGARTPAGGRDTAHEVAAAGSSSGPGTQADSASSTNAASGAVRSAGSPAAVAVDTTGSSDSVPAVDAGSPTSTAASTSDASRTSGDSASPARTSQEPTPLGGAAEPAHHHHDSRPPAGDDSIGHVFDQTNGVVEGIDGDSDGTAQSDVLSSEERADAKPAFESFADTEPQGTGGDDSRRTGS